jgi:hypothetical protein
LNVNTWANAVKEEEEIKVIVYPNPSAGIIRVEGLKGSFHTEIYDSKGSLVERFSLNQTLDISKLQDGFYFVVINGENYRINKKIQLLH